MSLPIAVNVDRADEVIASLSASSLSMLVPRPRFSADIGKAPHKFSELAGKCAALDSELNELVRETKVFLSAAIDAYKEKDSDMASQF